MLEEAISLDPTVIVPLDRLDDLLGSLPYLHSFLSVIWTCIFSVKASFLALFRLMIRNVSKPPTIYYWTVVVYMILAWMFIVSESFILCPHFGPDQGEPAFAASRKIWSKAHSGTVKCYPQINYPKTLGLMILITIIDVTSDIMSMFQPGFKKHVPDETQSQLFRSFFCADLV